MQGQRRAAWLAVAVAGLILASCAAGYPHRRLRAEDPATSTDGDPADDQPLYSLVTSCPAHMKASPTLKELYKGSGFDVVDLTATIEMTQQVSFANNFREADPTSWAPGNTRINYTVEISPHGGKLPSQLIARLHTGSCFSPLDQDTVYLRQEGNENSDVEAVLKIDRASHTGTSTTTKNYLIDYDKTESFVVYDGNTMVACCDMIPPFPDFPTEWSSTVEANIINQGYTYVQKETYSESKNKVRVDLHSYAADIVMVQDYTAKQTTIIYPANTTYPQGLCQVRDFIPSMTNFVDDSAGAVYSTKNFLMFEGTGGDPDSEPSFEPGHVSVRGIPSEVWFRKLQNKATNSSFEVSFFFPVNEWLVARENYHRMLKQISVVGTMDGEEINHLYSYINYRPYVAPDGVFDVCAIAPRGQNCNCTGKNAATQTQVDNVITFDENGEGVSVTKLSPAAVKANTVNTKCPANDTFTDEQKRWYGMWAAVGFAIGIVVAWIGSVCWYRTVVGVHGSDRMGHAKLRERPFIIGRQPSSYI